MHKNNFDFLRFLFAFIVIYAHVYELTNHATTFKVFSYIDSFLPVAGFFILSGFLIGRSFERSKSLADYLTKRAKRLLPAYIFIVSSTAILFASISDYSFAQYFKNPELFKYLVANLTFLNFLKPCLPGVFDSNYMCAVNGSLWTLKVEVGFYLIVPIIAYMIGKFRKPYVFLIASYILVILYNYFLSLYLLPEKQSLHFTLSHQLPSLMTYFLAGLMLNYYFDYIMKNINLLFAIALPLFLVEYFNHSQLLLPLSLSLILFFLGYSKKLKIANNFGRYGDFSYGMYIYHFPVIQLFIHLGFFNGGIHPWIILIILTCVILTLAFLSWNLLEKHFLKSRIPK